VRVGRDVVRVGGRGAAVVDADRLAVEGLEVAGVGLLVAGMPFPEVGALEEVEAGAVDGDGFERVDEAEDLGPAAAAVVFSELLEEGEHRRAVHDVVEDLGLGVYARQVAREGRLGRRDR
jgi:hypothetical protein